MRPPATAIVIGDGAIGLASAIALQRRGIATTIVGPEGAWRGASWGNAGHIATEQVEPLASPTTLRNVPRRLFLFGGPVGLPAGALPHWLPFAWRFARASTPDRFERGKAALGAMLAQAMPAWRRLTADSGVPDLLREDGHIVVWQDRVRAAAGAARWHRSATGTATFREMTPAAFAELQASLGMPLAGAIRFEGSGQITDLVTLDAALRMRFRAMGGTMRRARVTGIGGDTTARVTLDEADVIEADVALVASGVASASLLRPLGVRVPLIAERGYHIEVGDHGWPVDLPPMVFEERSIIVTRFAHGWRIAGFTEFADTGRPPDRRKWARLRNHARAIGFRADAGGREWMGARPTLPDYLPAIGRLPGRPAIAYAFGHQHLGLTLAATTGEAVAGLAGGVPGPFDITPFDLARFGGRAAAPRR